MEDCHLGYYVNKIPKKNHWRGDLHNFAGFAAMTLEKQPPTTLLG
jgi:hypothetical protein